MWSRLTNRCSKANRLPSPIFFFDPCISRARLFFQLRVWSWHSEDPASYKTIVKIYILGKNDVDRGSVSIMLFNQNSTEPQAIIKPPTCATDNPCYRGVECRDTREGPRCGRCPDGYVGDGLKCKPGITCNMRPCFAGKFFYFWKFISHSLIVTTPAGRFPVRASSPGYPFIPNSAPGRIRLYHDVMSDDI